MKTQEIAKSTSTNYSSMDVDSNRISNGIRMKREIIKFVLNNLAGYENVTFFEKLEELEKLEWVLVHEDSFEGTNTYMDETRFMDIHFESQNRHGRHLLVGRYPYESNPRKCYYVGFYFRVESIEDGNLFFSLISFTSRYQRMIDLKNAVAEYEKKNNCYYSKIVMNYSDLREKYLKN